MKLYGYSILFKFAIFTKFKLFRGAGRDMPATQPGHGAQSAQVRTGHGQLRYQCDYGGASIAVCFNFKLFKYLLI